MYVPYSAGKVTIINNYYARNDIKYYANIPDTVEYA